MVLPALLLPERFVTPELLPPELTRRLEGERSSFDALLTEMRQAKPAEGSAEEAQLVAKAARLMVRLGLEVGAAFPEVFRNGLQLFLADLVKKEFAETETERKLAIRQLQGAVERFAELAETVAVFFESLPQEALKTALADLEGLFQLPLEPDGLFLMRWQLDLMVAVQTAESAATQEFTFWARRAAVGARKVSALMTSMRTLGMRGEVARLRARFSWQSWDEDEVSRELLPWPPADESV